MATFSINLSDFSTPGVVYIREYDLSESIQISSNIARLVIGSSRKGPFNTVTYHEDAGSFNRYYGKIDHTLERRGSYFHRSAYTCLELGPIYAMNLLPLNNDPSEGPVDVIPYRSFSINAMEPNGYSKNELYSSFYRKKDFWEPDVENFLANVNKPSSPNKGKLLNVTNLSQTPMTIFITKTPTANVAQFNVTAREWFNGDVPTYLDEFDYISDTFIDITIIEGDWTNYPMLAIDPVYGPFFDTKGLKKHTMRDFMALGSVRTLGRFQGSIIPGLRDAANTIYSIDTIMNNNVNQLGLYVAIDVERLEEFDIMTSMEMLESDVSGFDLNGSTIAGTQDIVGLDEGGTQIVETPTPDAVNFLSYSFGIKSKYAFNYKTSFNYDHFQSALAILKSADALSLGHQHIGKNYGYFFNKIKVEYDPEWGPDRIEAEAYNTLRNQLKPGTSLIKGNYHDYSWITVTPTLKHLTVAQVYETTENGKQYLNIILSHPEKRKEMNDFRNSIPLSGYASSEPIVSIEKNISDHTIKVIVKPELITSIQDYIENTLQLTVDFTQINYYLENKNTKSYFYSNGVKIISGGDYDGYYEMILDNEYDRNLTIEELLYNYRIYFNTSPVVRPDWDIPVDEHNTGEFSNNEPIKFVLEPDALKHTTSGNDLMAYMYSKLGKYIANNIVQSGDMIAKVNFDIDPAHPGAATIQNAYLKFTKLVDGDGIEFYQVQAFEKLELQYDNLGRPIGFVFAGDNFKINSTEPFNVYDSGINTAGQTRGSYYKQIPIIQGSNNAAGTVFQMDIYNAEEVSVNDYIVSVLATDEADVFRYRLSRISRKKRKLDNTGNWIVEFEVETPAYIRTHNTEGGPCITRVLQIDDYANLYQGFYLEGFRLTDEHLPGNPRAASVRLSQQNQLEKILGMLAPENSRFMEYLSNTDKIDFRYIVDTYSGAGTIAPQMGPKVHLARLAKERGMCLTFINPPSIRDFSKSTDPRFTDMPTDRDPNPEVDTAYIATGGNLELNPSYTYSLVDELNGSKYAGGALPYLIVRENGKNFPVPTAAYYSNLYIKKFLDGRPFDVPAGMNAVISERNFVGLEYDFTTRDIKNITSMGLNVIQNIPNNGPTMMSNELMYQRTQSAFNSMHVRDLLITIERNISQFLRRYLFKKNNPSIRIEIVNWINSYLASVKSLEGIYAYSVIMDDSNNTNEVLDANMGICTIIVEPQKSIESFLLNVVTTATGKISTTAFNQIIM